VAEPAAGSEDRAPDGRRLTLLAMPEPQSTFSESWYRLANQRLWLRPGVRVRRQNYRGERWIVLENPFSNEFFRLRPAGYEFLARLRPDRTVQEAWQECLDRFPDEAPGQEAVLQLLSQLYFANLLQYEHAADSAQLFKRYKKRRQREVTARFLNVMFMRFPLLDPDRFLVRTLPVIGKLISPVGALLWLLVVGGAVKVALDNWPALKEQTQAVLAPGNLPLLYLGLVLIKTLHEFGHAYFCRKFGGEVHTMGIMLMIFTPIPYVDATSSWGFRSRWRRILVGAAGMIVEVFFAALMTFVWANTGPGTLHSLAYNMMFVASVSTLIFNANPLLRFDGYYILSDLLEIPNLSQRANRQLGYYFERYLFGVNRADPPAQSRREAAWLVVFGIASGIYRVIVFGGILLLVADRFLILGLIMAAVCAISWVTVPAGKFIHYLATSPKLDRTRPRAVAATLGVLAALLVLLAVIPFPSHFRAPGVVQARERTQVANQTAGYLAEILAPPGRQVRRGQPLLRLHSPELDLELAGVRARLAEVEARLREAMTEAAPNLKPLASLAQATTNRLNKLLDDQANLVLTARHDGVWVAPGIEDFVGRWLPRGTPLGLLIDAREFEFVATVKQVDADALFARRIPGAEVRLAGEAARVVPIGEWKVVPGGHHVLPSPALGWGAGGEMPIALDDPQGRRAAEPFFEVLAALPRSAEAALLHGRSGKIRFDLAPEPLLPRWIRRLRQLLQKRYQI
jgi:putative peptide zinc metalloprotease protein